MKLDDGAEAKMSDRQACDIYALVVCAFDSIQLIDIILIAFIFGASSLSMDDDVDDEKSNNHVFVFDNKGKSDNKLQFEGNVKGDHLGPAKTGNNNGITFPSNLEQLKELAQIMSKYSETNFQYVLLLFSSAYLFKQTFAIPGSVFLVRTIQQTDKQTATIKILIFVYF